MKNNKPGLNEIEINLCENIKKYAKINGFSVAEIATYLGVSAQTVYHYYRKLIVPPISTIYRFSILFQVSIYELLGLPEPKSKN